LAGGDTTADVVGDRSVTSIQNTASRSLNLISAKKFVVAAIAGRS
jgi:hypothetical protein